MSKCIERHDLTRNVIVCDREQGHEGMHRDNGQNLYWHPGAPHLESVTPAEQAEVEAHRVSRKK